MRERVLEHVARPRELAGQVVGVVKHRLGDQPVHVMTVAGDRLSLRLLRGTRDATGSGTQPPGTSRVKLLVVRDLAGLVLS
jgi:hypothetical protein